MDSYSTPDSNFNERARLVGLKELFQRHPIASAGLIFAANFILTVTALLVLKVFFPMLDLALSGIIFQTVMMFIGLSALGWWREAGFNPPRQWRELRLLWLPAIVILIPPLLSGLKLIEPATALYLVVGYLLTGITEEGIFRGLILKVLRPAGQMRAVVISAVLFGLMHLVNLFIRSNPAIVLAQCVGAFADGVGFAALRIRTNTIWPLVLLHMLHDLLLQYTRLPAIPLDVAQVTILMFYGFYLMRQPKKGSMGVSPA